MFPGIAVQHQLKKAEQNTEALDTTGVGPAQAMKRIKFASDIERIEWLERARVAAIVGTCPRTVSSVISGVKCWSSFARKYLKVWRFASSVSDRAL